MMRIAGICMFVLLTGLHAASQDADTLAIPGAVLRRNIPYADKDPKQNFDLYRPASASVKDRLPLMIWIHGGGWWTGGKKYMEIPWMIGHGYAIASIGYRFSQDSIFPAQVRDCYAAIRYILRHAPDYGLDTSRVVIGGASAGGHLASLVGMTLNNNRRDFDAEAGRGRKIHVRGILNFYGPCDIYAFHGDGAAYKVDSASSSVSRMLGAPAMLRPDLAKWASPTSYVDKGDPPVLTIHGDKDPIVHYYLGVLFYNVLRLAGVRAGLLTIPGGGHGGAEFSDTERQERIQAWLNQVLQ